MTTRSLQKPPQQQSASASDLLEFTEHPSYLRFLRRHSRLCESSNLEVRAVRDLCQSVMTNSSVPCQLGVFAKQRIECETELCLYSARWRAPTAGDKDRCSTHLRAISGLRDIAILDGEHTSKLFRRYTLATHSIEAICCLSAQDFEPVGLTPLQLVRFRTEMPKGCMVNTVQGRFNSQGRKLSPNCRWFDMNQKNRVDDGRMDVLKATRTIEAGEELVVDKYNNKEEKQRRDHSPVSLTASPSTSSQQLGSHLHLQRGLLHSFVKAEEVAYRDFRYSEWTLPANTPSMELRLSASNLVNGALGVFPTTKKCSPKSFVVVYSDRAVLMWDEQHERFNQHYYCPTAVSLPVLDYVEIDPNTASRMGLKKRIKNGWEVSVVLVGDPTSVGAVVNSPLNSGVKANCSLESVPVAKLSSYLEVVDNKTWVKSEIVSLFRNREPIPGDARRVELLTRYEGTKEESDFESSRFWKHQVQGEADNPHCDTCFERFLKDESKPMMLCSGKQCSAARHRSCFQDDSYRLPDWYCSACAKLPHAFMGIVPKVTAVCCATPPAKSPSPVRLCIRPSYSFTATPSPSQADQPVDQVRPAHVGTASSNSAPPAIVPTSLSPRLNLSAQPLVRSLTQMPQTFQVSKRLLLLSTRTASTPSSTGACIPTSRRTSAPLSISSKATMNDLLEARTSLNDQGKEKIREVWKRYADVLKKLNAQWPLSYPTDQESKREQMMFERLLFTYDWLRHCCGKMEKLLERNASSNSVAMFSSPDKLQEVRLQFLKKYDFDDDRIRLYCNDEISRLRTENSSGCFWMNQRVCMNCFTLLIGSRSTIYRVLKPTVHVDAPRKKPVVDLLVTHLYSFIEQNRQTNPNNGFAKDGSNVAIAVLPDATKISARQRFQDVLNEQTDSKIQVSKTTFDRCLKEVEVLYGLRASMNQTKDLALCQLCLGYQKQITLANIARHLEDTAQTYEAVRVAKLAFTNHTLEWQEQRTHFNDRKMQALRAPWLLWTITLDGMDSSKTQLPHYMQKNKEPATEFMLEHRVVGAFCFGGPVLCMGMSSFDDVPGKGGAASVTGIELILDHQWNAMDPTRICLDYSKSVKSDAPPAPGPDANVSHSEQPKVEFMWPEGCHFTFDNTASDNKNAHTFRFFAALVMAGVFRYITVSNLMVGHTHDIVDQMFSVWSRSLDTNDAPTLEEMHKRFREHYSSKIYELKSHLEHTKSLSGELSSRVVQLAAQLGVAPRLVLLEMVADAKTWCYKSIPYLANAHVFYLVKEEVVLSERANGSKVTSNVIAMYSRMFAKSTQDKTVFHNPAWANVRFGPWSARTVIMTEDQLPKDDPYCCPPRVVDNIDKVREHIDKRADPNGLCDMKVEQHAEMSKLLTKFEVRFQELGKKCPTCADLMQQLKAIGPISNKQGMSVQQVELARQQSTRKNQVMKQLENHMDDKSQLARHESFKMQSWWTKWLDRVKQYIRPYYISRELVSEEASIVFSAQAAQLGRQVHPDVLPSDKGAPPLYHNSVSKTRERNLGLPQAGQFIVARGNTVQEPIWVGELLSESGFEMPSKHRAKSNPKQSPPTVDSAPIKATKPKSRKSSRSASAAASVKIAAVASDSMDSDDMPLSSLLSGGSAAQPESDFEADEQFEETKHDSEADEAEDVPMSAASSSSCLTKRSRTSNAAAAASSKSARPDVSVCDAASASRANKTLYKVRWLVRADCTALDRLTKIDWESEMTKVGALAAWQTAIEQFKAGKFVPLPGAAVEHHRSLKYTNSRPPAEPEQVQHGQLIYWGPRDSILTSSGVLAKKTFDLVKEDLCELKDKQHNMSIDYSTAYEQ